MYHSECALVVMDRRELLRAQWGADLNYRPRIIEPHKSHRTQNPKTQSRHNPEIQQMMMKDPLAR